MTDLFREYFSIQSHEIQQGFEQRIHFNLELYENDLQTLVREYYKEVFSQKAKYWLEINKEITLVNLRSNA